MNFHYAINSGVMLKCPAVSFHNLTNKLVSCGQYLHNLLNEYAEEILLLMHTSSQSLLIVMYKMYKYLIYGNDNESFVEAVSTSKLSS